MPLTQYARDNMLSWVGTAGSPTRPTAWYLSMHTGFPGDTGTTILSELSGSGYARTQMTGGNALTLSSHALSNAGSVSPAAATGTWSAVTFLGICDASSAGNLLAYTELSQSGASFFLGSGTFANPGSGYAVNDTITITSGGGAVITVNAVATVNGVAGVPYQFRVTTPGSVSSPPANPAATTTSGSGSGATFNGIWLQTPASFQLNNGDSISFGTGKIVISLA